MAQKFEFKSPVQAFVHSKVYEVSTPFGDWILETKLRTYIDRSEICLSTVPIKDRHKMENLIITVKLYGGLSSVSTDPKFIVFEEAYPEPEYYLPDYSKYFIAYLEVPYSIFETHAIGHLKYYFKIFFEEKPKGFAFVEPPAPLPNSTASYMSSLFDSNKFADITIKTADGKKVKAAKFALSRSSVFDAMLNRHDRKEAKTGVIQITDIDHEVMKELIRYMYSDEVPKLKEIALELMIAANKYDLPGLFELCKNYMMANITLDTFANVLIYADKLEIEDLEKAIIQYILDHNETVLASDEWKRLKENHVQVAMKVLEHRFKASK